MINAGKYSKNPTLCNEICYEDENLKLTKVWTWDVVGIYEKEDANVCTVLLCGQYANGGGKSTFVSYDGKRLTDIEMDWRGDYEDEMWLFAIYGKGYGYFDKDINLVIPPKYHYANDFRNGYASVNDGNEWLYIDKKGNEIRLKNKYERLGHFSDGMALVSTMSINRNDLRYATDYEDDIGCWGYIDKNGNEVIKPQYIYAFDFENDRAIVAKGKWEKKKKWKNEYWTEQELWGVIDKNGNEIIPCKYDEIKQFMNDDWSMCKDYYQVHVGGWKNGKWAIADRNGNFITEPIFEDEYYDYGFDMFAFRNEDTLDDIPLGIYDLKQNKILFEPQFEDVYLFDKDLIRVEVFDKDLGYNIQKIIDKTGTELFKSNYTSIRVSTCPYQAEIKLNNRKIFKLIDKNGNVLESCEADDIGNLYTSDFWDEVYFAEGTYIFKKDGKFGLKTINGKEILPAIYDEVYPRDNHWYLVMKDKNDRFSHGLCKANGTFIFEPKYGHIIVCKNTNKIICNCKNGVEVYKYEII